MAREVSIDFYMIRNIQDFYNSLKFNLDLPDYFGNNLDALYDIITGYVELPMELNLYNMSLDQLEYFENLLETLEDAEESVDGFSFSCSLLNYGGDEEE